MLLGFLLIGGAPSGTGAPPAGNHILDRHPGRRNRQRTGDRAGCSYADDLAWWNQLGASNARPVDQSGDHGHRMSVLPVQTAAIPGQPGSGCRQSAPQSRYRTPSAGRAAVRRGRGWIIKKRNTRLASMPAGSHPSSVVCVMPPVEPSPTPTPRPRRSTRRGASLSAEVALNYVNPRAAQRRRRSPATTL